MIILHMVKIIKNLLYSIKEKDFGCFYPGKLKVKTCLESVPKLGLITNCDKFLISSLLIGLWCLDLQKIFTIIN